MKSIQRTLLALGFVMAMFMALPAAPVQAEPAAENWYCYTPFGGSSPYGTRMTWEQRRIYDCRDGWIDIYSAYSGQKILELNGTCAFNKNRAGWSDSSIRSYCKTGN